MRHAPSLLACLAAAAPAFAVPAAELDPVEVTSRRSETPSSALPPGAVRLTREQLDQNLVRNIDDATRYEPGIDVPADPVRRGNAGYTIRGIGGNRILMLIDGIRMPEAYMGGGPNTAIAGRDFVDMESLRAIEIVKGPQSSLYGSDAIGGVVGYRTKTVADILSPGARLGGSLKGFAASADDSHGGTASLGFRTDRADGLLVHTLRNGHDTDNQGHNDSRGATRTTPNPQHWHGDNILARLGWNITDTQRLELVYDRYRRRTGTREESAVGRSVTSRIADDRTVRQRVMLDWSAHDLGPVHRLGVRLYRQTLNTADNTLDTGTERSWRGSNRADRTHFTRSTYAFNQVVSGLTLDIEHRFEAMGASNRLLWGADINRTDSERPRDKLRIYADGSSTHTIPSPVPRAPAETYPNKTFPDSTSDRLGLFVQDDMHFASGLTVTPSLRWDLFRMRPHIDQAYLNAGSARLPTRYSDSAVSPGLGLSMPFARHYTAFLQLTTGFRAPPFDEANMAFRNATYGYAVESNPDLKSERSRSIELGLKGEWNALDLGVTAFRSHYTDFIERVATGRDGPIRIYQNRNVGRVDIQGLEARTDWRPAPNWRLRGALAYSHGDNRSDNRPLDTIAPLSAVLGLAYDSDRWGADSHFRAVARKHRVSDDSFFRAPGYATLDLTAYWRPHRSLTARAGLYNVFDRKYWVAASVNGFKATDPAIDRYTRPGRNAGASLEYLF